MHGYWVVTIEGLTYIDGDFSTPVGTLFIGRNPMDTLFNKEGKISLESYISIFGYEELIPLDECIGLALQRMGRNKTIKKRVLNNENSGSGVGIISIPEDWIPEEWLGKE